MELSAFLRYLHSVLMGLINSQFDDFFTMTSVFLSTPDSKLSSPDLILSSPD